MCVEAGVASSAAAVVINMIRGRDGERVPSLAIY